MPKHGYYAHDCWPNVGQQWSKVARGIWIDRAASLVLVPWYPGTVHAILV
jgi:hypothetical protein